MDVKIVNNPKIIVSMSMEDAEVIFGFLSSIETSLLAGAPFLLLNKIGESLGGD